MSALYPGGAPSDDDPADVFSMAPAWDDGVADAVALVEAARAGDGLGFGAVGRHCDKDAVLVVLAKMVACVLDEEAVTPDGFRRWADNAVRRP